MKLEDWSVADDDDDEIIIIIIIILTDVAIRAGRNGRQKEAEKKLKYQNLCIERYNKCGT